MKAIILGILHHLWSGLHSFLKRVGPRLAPKEMGDFSVSGAKAYRVIGALITTIGVQALATEVAFLVIGNIGKGRYENLTGRFARTFSGADEGLYAKADLLLNSSTRFLVVGVVIGILGIVVLRYPQLIHQKLRDSGFLRDEEYVRHASRDSGSPEVEYSDPERVQYPTSFY